MRKSEVEKNFIKINGMQLMNILRNSGLNLKTIRTGNRFHSTRNTCIYDPNMSKRYWTVVVYSYSKVEDPRYFNKGRTLETSENYLNPDFKYLLEKT